MNIHLLHDCHFAAKFIANQKEYAPEGENKYYVYSLTPGALEPSYVNANDVNFVVGGIPEVVKVMLDVDSGNRLFAHYLSEAAISVISKKDFKEVVWVFWGGEFFNHPNYIERYLQPLTRNWYQKQAGIRLNIQKSKANEWRRKLTNTSLAKAVNKVDVLAHFVREDVENINQLCSAKIKHFQFSYASVAQEGKSFDNVDKEYLLIGNNNTATNNHLDAVPVIQELLKREDLKILVPLSYPQNESYQQLIMDKYKGEFGNRCVLLTEYLEAEDYAKLLNGVSVAYLPQIRTQAGGNILSLMTNGSRLIMPAENNFGRQLKSWGAQLWFDNDLNSLPKVLEEKDSQKNKAIIEEYFGIERVRKQYVELLNQ